MPSYGTATDSRQVTHVISVTELPYVDFVCGYVPQDFQWSVDSHADTLAHVEPYSCRDCAVVLAAVAEQVA